MPDSKRTKSSLVLHDDDTLNLLAEVVHKVKNSLGGIGGFAALLERDLGPQDARTVLSQRIQDGVVRINDLIVHLMTFINTPDPSFQPLNPIPIIRQAWTECTEDYSNHVNSLDLQNHTTSPSIQLVADPDTFRLLVLHALRFGRLVGGKIDNVQLNRQSDRSVSFDVVFPHTMKIFEGSESTLSYLRTGGSVEAKLSLYIVIKMATFNSASVSLFSKDPDQEILSIHFSKGKQV
jgi:light-regulated signal transduction histidine kinase (bacteriophytochrome)